MYADQVTGLYYNMARYYDSRIGRYISSDPIGLSGGLNTYGYAYQNPLRYIGPYGLWAWGDPIDQDWVNGITGFGDGAYKAITLGIGNLQDIRNAAGIDGDVNQCSSAYKWGHGAGEGVGGFALGGAGIKALGRVTGPLKQWVRVGASYSKSLDKPIAMSIRWGASPAGGGKYIEQIPSPALQDFNQWLRNRSLPFGGWRAADPGHFHLW